VLTTDLAFTDPSWSPRDGDLRECVRPPAGTVANVAGVLRAGSPCRAHDAWIACNEWKNSIVDAGDPESSVW